MTAVALFATTFVLVFLLAVQQFNVHYNEVTRAFISSTGIALLNLVLLKVMPQHTTLIENAAYVFGSSFGVIAGMRCRPLLARWVECGRQLLRRQG